MATAVRAFIGLGANLGDAAATIADALDRLAAIDGVRLVAVSSLYRTAPFEAEGPDFLNAVAEVATTLPAGELLRRLQAIERSHGRERPYRNAPRTLDLDLLVWNALRIDTPGLQLPHPRMHLRAFVLAPLAEIAPEVELPGLPPLGEMLRACADQRIDAIADPRSLLASSRVDKESGR